MQIFLFIVFLFVVSLMHIVPRAIAKIGKEQSSYNVIVFAILLAIGSTFISPLILNWYLNFLFDLTLDYWIAFAFLIVLNIFAEDFKSEGEK